MIRKTETALSQVDTHGHSSRCIRSSLVPSDKIVNSVSNSSEVHISNHSSNIYNAPVVIIYQQRDTVEQFSSKKSTAVQENSFSRRLCSISRVQQLYSVKCYMAIPILLLLVIVLMIWLLGSKNPHTANSGSLSNTTSDQSDLRIISRLEWNATLPKAEATLLISRPTPLVVIHHSETTSCYSLEQCVMLVQLIQKYDMDNHHWHDIGYNFLVGGDGLVYEGRGWNVGAAHTLGYNYWSIGISLIGIFFKEEPTKVQLRATQQLIEYGVKNGYISVDYKLLGHRQCRNSTDPGDALYSIIMTWANWSSKCQLK